MWALLLYLLALSWLKFGTGGGTGGNGTCVSPLERAGCDTADHFHGNLSLNCAGPEFIIDYDTRLQPDQALTDLQIFVECSKPCSENSGQTLYYYDLTNQVVSTLGIENGTINGSTNLPTTKEVEYCKVFGCFSYFSLDLGAHKHGKFHQRNCFYDISSTSSPPSIATTATAMLVNSDEAMTDLSVPYESGSGHWGDNETNVDLSSNDWSSTLDFEVYKIFASTQRAQTSDVSDAAPVEVLVAVAVSVLVVVIVLAVIAIWICHCVRYKLKSNKTQLPFRKTLYGDDIAVDFEVYSVPAKLFTATPTGSQFSVFDMYYYEDKKKRLSISVDQEQIKIVKHQSIHDAAAGTANCSILEATDSRKTETKQLTEVLEGDNSNHKLDERSHSFFDGQPDSLPVGKSHPLKLVGSPTGSGYLSVDSPDIASHPSSPCILQDMSFSPEPSSINMRDKNMSGSPSPSSLQHRMEFDKRDYIMECRQTLMEDQDEELSDHFSTKSHEQNAELFYFPNCSYQSQPNPNCNIFHLEQCSFDSSHGEYTNEWISSHSNCVPKNTSEDDSTLNMAWGYNVDMDETVSVKDDCKDSYRNSRESSSSCQINDSDEIKLYIEENSPPNMVSDFQKNESYFFSNSSFRFTRHSPVEFRYPCQISDISASGNLWTEYANVGEVNDCEFYFSPTHRSASHLQEATIYDSFSPTKDEHAPFSCSSPTSSYQKQSGTETVSKTVDTSSCTSLNVINYSFDRDETLKEAESVYV